MAANADREKLVEAYGQACYDEGIAVARRDSQRDREATTRELNARAALLAAMEPVGGEVMEIVEHRYHTDGRPTLTVAGLYGEQFQSGDKVRVSKVEAP